MWTYEYRDKPRPCYRIQDGSDDGDVAEAWDEDVAQALVDAMTDRELFHRPSSIDPGHTACGLVLERFPINLNLQLGEGETCARCTHVVAQVAKAREQVRPSK